MYVVRWNKYTVVSPRMYQTNTLCWVFDVLAHWINSLWVVMSLHWDTLFRDIVWYITVINDCDRRVTLLIVIHFVLIYFFRLFSFLCILIIASSTLNTKEILKLYSIEQKIYPYLQEEWYVYHSDLSWYVPDCTVL